MMATLLRRPFIAGLAFLAVALAVLLAFEVAGTSRSRIPAGTVRPVTPAPAKLLPPVTPTPAEQAYPEVVARPLFTPTRRPAPAQQVAAAPTFNRGQFQLLGVIIAGNSKTAMLREKASGKIHRVDLGREVNGIKVASIERDTVTLAQGGETEVVPLQVQKAAAAAAVASTAGAAGPFAQAPGQPIAHPVPPGAHPQPPAHPTAPPAPFQLPPASAALLGVPPPGTPQAAAAAAAAPQATTPLSPEELLARRRARRTQPNP
jgi:hypothetical protein